MSLKIIPAIIVLMFFSLVSYGQSESSSSETFDPKKHAYHVKQYVWVTSKEGKDVECVIHGHISKHKYYVRQLGSGRQGKVVDKYIRPMTEAEIATAKSNKGKK